MAGRLAPTAIAAGAALLLGGCGTVNIVKSKPLSMGNLGPSWTYYGSYPLPVSTFTVEIKDASSGPAGGSAATPPVTINNYVTPPPSPPPPGTDPGGATLKDKKAPPGCDDLKKAYGALRQSYIAGVIPLGDAIASLRKDATVRKVLDLPAPLPPDLELRAKDLLKKRASSDALYAQAVAMGVQVSVACKLAISVTITQGIAGDEQGNFGAYVKDDDWSHVTLSSKTDANGLLTSASTTADDATGSVFVAVVQTIMSFVGTFGAAPTFSATTVSGQIYPNLVLQATDFAPPTLPALDIGAPIPKEPKLIKLTELIAHAVDVGAGVTVAADCGSAPVAATPSKDGTIDGLATSAQRACVLTASWSDGQPHEKRVPVNVLDSHLIVALPMPKTRLVARKTTYGFTDGRLTSVDYDKPSTALALATAPGTALTSGLSAFSTALQGRKGVTQGKADNLTAQANMATAQAAILDAQAKVLTSQAALKKAEAAAAAAETKP